MRNIGDIPAMSWKCHCVCWVSTTLFAAHIKRARVHKTCGVVCSQFTNTNIVIRIYIIKYGNGRGNAKARAYMAVLFKCSVPTVAASCIKTLPLHSNSIYKSKNMGFYLIGAYAYEDSLKCN